MSGQRETSGTRWTWLLAVPVLCCAGHAVLVALGVGSLATVVGGTTGRVALAAGGAVVLLNVVVFVLFRRRGKA